MIQAPHNNAAQNQYTAGQTPAQAHPSFYQASINKEAPRQTIEFPQREKRVQESANFQEQMYDGSVIFWNLINLIILIPLVLSLCCNLGALASNIHKNIKLSKKNDEIIE